MKLWQKGIILIACAIGLSTLLRMFEIKGLINELSRLFTVAATIVFILGIFRKDK